MNQIVDREIDQASLEASALAVAQALRARRRKETIQSSIVAIVLFLVVGALLAVVTLVSSRTEVPQIVAYQLIGDPQEKPPEIKKVSVTSKPRPPGSSSSMAKVIASESASAVAVPIPDAPVLDGFIGIEESFGTGFGSGDGAGYGGGGASFFGTKREGERVVFCVDYSGSMESDIEGDRGGTRIAALKKELGAAINRLSSSMSLSIIFFSTTAWTIETEGPDYFGKGWNGAGQAPKNLWYPALDRVKNALTDQVQAMPPKGGTNWYPPLAMALAMKPPPQIIYLLSDGEPRDGDYVLDQMEELNPEGIPINTIAFELPGSPAGQLQKIAQETGGQFTMIYRGKRLTGGSAERLTDSKYD